MKLFLLSISAVITLSSQATTHEVELGGGPGTGNSPYYDPQNLTINQGDTLHWTWVQGQHNCTSTMGPENFASGTHTAPFEWEFVFDTPGTYDYECTVGTHSNTQFGTIVVNAVNNIMGKGEPMISDFSLYPNPTTAKVNVENSFIDNNYELVIFDLTGKVVLSVTPVNSYQYSIDLSAIEAGVYIVQLSSEKGSIRKRLTIK